MLIETPTWVRRLPRGRTLLLLMLGAGLALAACSHAPVLPQPPETAKNEVAPSSTPSPTPPPQVPEAGTGTPTTDPLGLDAATGPPEPKTAEEAVAIAVAEQNLLDRMRAGFVLSDADHVA